MKLLSVIIAVVICPAISLTSRSRFRTRRAEFSIRNTAIVSKIDYIPLNSDKRTQHSNISYIVKGAFIYFLLNVRKVFASGAISGEVVKSNLTPIQGVSIWGALFLLSASLHSAESAITKISPWKVQEFVDEEGPGSPFATLSAKTTTLLSTILVTTTACSIYR